MDAQQIGLGCISSFFFISADFHFLYLGLTVTNLVHIYYKNLLNFNIKPELLVGIKPGLLLMCDFQTVIGSNFTTFDCKFSWYLNAGLKLQSWSILIPDRIK